MNNSDDLLTRLGKQRLADLLGRAQKGKSLSEGQRKELARLQQQYLAAKSVSCAAGVQEGRPFAVVPVGYAPAVATDDQLADVFGVSERTVREWKSDPDWPAGQRGPYLLGGKLSEFVRKRAEKSGAATTPSERGQVELEISRIERDLKLAKLHEKQTRGIPPEARSAVRMVTTAWLNDLKDADETYAGVLNFMMDRMRSRKSELLSVSP